MHTRLRIVCMLIIVLIVAVFSFCVPSRASATAGNVKGKVTDIRTAAPLPFANIVVLGSGRGAVTNEKGEYFVSGVPPGEYTIRVSLVGYRTHEAKRIVIETHGTVVLDFKLASEDIEIEGVTVVGEAPLVDVMKTAGDQTFGREKIEQIPNVKEAKDVIGLQAGTVKFGGQLFLRGGRANETQILIDGVPVNDVGGRVGTAGTSTANEQLQQLYSGNVTAGVGGALSVAANAIQSVSVSSSGLDGELGNAQSGVVNIITKTGGENFTGSVHYRTDGMANSGFNERYYAMYAGGPEPITSFLLPSFGIDVPGKLAFFFNGTFDQSDGPYSFNTSQFYHPLKRMVKFSGLFGNILNDLGFTYSDKQNNKFTFNSKFTYAIGENDHFSFSYRANAGSSHPLGGVYIWKHLSDSTSSSVELITQNVFHWTHLLGVSSLLKGYVSRLETKRTSSVGALSPDQYSTVTDNNLRDPSSDGFNDLGTGQAWSSSNTVVWNVKFDYNSQVHPLHFLKTGLDYYYEGYQSTAVSFPQIRDTSTRGLFPGYGAARWVSNNLPSRGAMYAQDNIELSSINIHIVLRYDWFYPGKQVYDREFVKRYEKVTNDGNRDTPYEYADWVDYEGSRDPARLPADPDNTTFKARSFWHAFTHGYFSPRLAIGYPISTRTVFYFNYSHFLQHPEREQYFRDPISTAFTSNTVGNPSLKPQKTIQYEAGFEQLIFEDLSLKIQGFYKDIFDYPAFRTVPASLPVDKWVNLDYGSVRGFEIIVTKQARDHYQGSIGYTYQLAKGRSSDPYAVQASPQLYGLPREVRTDYDQQHTLNVFAAYRVGPTEDYDLFGLQFNNWGVSMTWSFGSGFPFTPTNIALSTRSFEEQYLKNSADGPYTSEVNISLYKGFIFLEKLNLALSLDVTNLFNRRNVDLNAAGFNAFTGKAIVYGDYDPINGPIYSWSGVEGGNSFDARVPPFIFRAPRHVVLGVRLSWD